MTGYQNSYNFPKGLKMTLQGLLNLPQLLNAGDVSYGVITKGLVLNLEGIQQRPERLYSNFYKLIMSTEILL